MGLVAEWANRILVMNNGELIADDSSEVIFQQDELLEKANLMPPQIISLCNELNYPYCPTVDSFVEYWKTLDQRGVSVGN
jgi:energy-coupling factor transport system ATP-binding protein